VQDDAGHTHIRVLAGTATSGRPVFEVLPARRLQQEYQVDGSPGLAYGFAAGDRIRLRDDGTFDVVARGGNLCLRLYPETRPSDASVNTTANSWAAEQGCTWEFGNVYDDDGQVLDWITG
jgi:hypothetical protein